MNQPLTPSNPVIASMVTILKSYAGQKIFPVECERAEWMKERWAKQISSGKHFGKMAARSVRFEQLNSAMKAFEQSTKNEKGDYSYAYLAGFYMQQLLMLAADNQDSTEDLVRLLNRYSVANLQQTLA